MAEPQLTQQYVASGQVYFEYRDYPFRKDESVEAAEASRCAEEQDMFWEFHDTLYHNQADDRAGAFARERLDRIAEVVGLDMDEFDECMDENRYEDAVQQEMDNAAAMGVTGTPTFLINDEMVFTGNYAEVQAAIEEALAGGGS